MEMRFTLGNSKRRSLVWSQTEPLFFQTLRSITLHWNILQESSRYSSECFCTLCHILSMFSTTPPPQFNLRKSPLESKFPGTCALRNAGCVPECYCATLYLFCFKNDYAVIDSRLAEWRARLMSSSQKRSTSYTGRLFQKHICYAP